MGIDGYQTDDFLGRAFTPKYETDDGIGSLFTHDLYGYAAYDAAKVLAENWRDSTDAGEELADLLDDVDVVIALLAAWRDAVRARFVPPGTQ